LSCLRGLPSSEIKTSAATATNKAREIKSLAYGLAYWGPVIDGDVLLDHPLTEYRKGHFTKVPLIIDHNFWEGLAYTRVSLQTTEDVLSDLSALWHDADQQYAETALSLYPESSHNASNLKDLTYYEQFKELLGGQEPSNAFVQRSLLFGDAIVNCPTTYIAQAVAEAGLPAFKMVFNASHQLHGATDASVYSSDINGTFVIIHSSKYPMLNTDI
jgi:carboxylesterase type B